MRWGRKERRCCGAGCGSSKRSSGGRAAGITRAEVIAIFARDPRGARRTGDQRDHYVSGRPNDLQAGRQKIASADGVDLGWGAESHVLDKDFQPAKNIINYALFFDLCVDVAKLPADKLKAYYEVELKALSAMNDSGLPTAKQKREAKEAARDRLEVEAKDGRYKKRKLVPVMWDSVTNEVLFGATSLTHVDRLVSLFQQTFGFGLEPVSAGKRAHELAATAVDDSLSSAFIPGVSAGDVAWIPDDTSRDFLGNEFFLWLWYSRKLIPTPSRYPTSRKSPSCWRVR